MFFRATLFSAFGASKRWLATNPDGSTRALTTADYYKAVRSAIVLSISPPALPHRCTPVSWRWPLQAGSVHVAGSWHVAGMACDKAVLLAGCKCVQMW